MYLKRLLIKNLKGFDNLDFNFTRPNGKYEGWTVLTGDNGAGKSSILKAIGIAMLGRENARALQPSFKGWIQNGKDEAEISLYIQKGESDKYSQQGNVSSSFNVTIKLEKNDDSEPTYSIVRPPKKALLAERSLWSPQAKGWFVCAYGPFRRVFGASADAQRQMVAPIIDRFVTLFLEDASLNEVDRWLRKKKHQQLEGDINAGKELDIVLEILKDELLPNGFKVEKVDSNGLWLTDSKGQLLSWSEMSDGYRSALALLMDILRHLISTFGTENIVQKNESDSLECILDGIILIDEVDSHLHPEWQRKIGFWLKRKFPKIQFLVTSHSPFICQAADEGGIFHLPTPGTGNEAFRISDEDYRKIISSKTDTILLSKAFGLENTRSPKAVDARRELSKLNAKKLAGVSLSSKEEETVKQLSLYQTND